MWKQQKKKKKKTADDGKEKVKLQKNKIKYFATISLSLSFASSGAGWPKALGSSESYSRFIDQTKKLLTISLLFISFQVSDVTPIST